MPAPKNRSQAPETSAVDEAAADAPDAVLPAPEPTGSAPAAETPAPAPAPVEPPAAPEPAPAPEPTPEAGIAAAAAMVHDDAAEVVAAVTTDLAAPEHVVDSALAYVRAAAAAVSGQCHVLSAALHAVETRIAEAVNALRAAEQAAAHRLDLREDLADLRRYLAK